MERGMKENTKTSASTLREGHGHNAETKVKSQLGRMDKNRLTKKITEYF